MPRREAAFNATDLARLRMFKPEHQCAIVATICLAMCVAWPSLTIFSAVLAFVAFCAVLLHYKVLGMTNLAFLFLGFTLVIILSDSILWNLLLSLANLPSGEANELHNGAIQYIAMAIDAMVLGACIVTWRHISMREILSLSRSQVRCPSIYLTAAFVPLFLNLILYYTSFRGLEYVEIHKAGLGIEKYILFSVVITDAAFMRMFGSWTSLRRKHRLALGAAVLLYLFIYIVLMPLRTHLFVFGMYSFYFLGSRIRWRLKIALLTGGILLFSWMAVHRSNPEDNLREMGPAQSTLSALSFGTGMVDMVPWAYDQVRSKGCTWGTTYLLELVSAADAPSVRYVRDIDPVYADAGGGYGFFYIAELLLNFGYLGGLLGAFFLGMVLQKLSTMPAFVVRSTVLPALLALSFPLIRNDFTTTLKSVLYLIISCFILDRLALASHAFGGLIKVAKLSAATKQQLQFRQGSNPL